MRAATRRNCCRPGRRFDPARVTPALVDLYYDMTLREGNRRALSRRLAQGYSADTRQLAQLSMPTLVLWVGRDRLTPPDFARWFARDIAGSRLVVFDDLGHVPHEEDPQRTVQEVRRFLAQPDSALGRSPASS